MAWRRRQRRCNVAQAAMAKWTSGHVLEASQRRHIMIKGLLLVTAVPLTVPSK